MCMGLQGGPTQILVPYLLSCVPLTMRQILGSKACAASAQIVYQHLQLSDKSHCWKDMVPVQQR